MAQSHRVFRLSYTSTPRDDPILNRCRDGMAFSEVNEALREADYTYQTAIMLYPNDRRGLDEGYPKFQPSDLVVLTTRPPLDDKANHGQRKIILRNYGPLESEILDVVCRKYLHYCSRRFVELTARAGALLNPEVNPDRWKNVEFFENHQTDQKAPSRGQSVDRRHLAALIKKHHLDRERVEPPTAGRLSTVAYLIRDHLPSVGCDVLVSFGLDGVCTLVWNHLVRIRHPQWLTKRGFVMAELVFEKFKGAQTKPPITAAFADDLVKIRVLAESGPIE